MDTESVQVMVMMQGSYASRRRAHCTHWTCGCCILYSYCLPNRDPIRVISKKADTLISQIFLRSHDNCTARMRLKGDKQEDSITRPNESLLRYHDYSP